MHTFPRFTRYRALPRLTAACAVILSCLSLPARAQQPGDNLFSGIQIHTINIRFSQEHYWDTLTANYNRGLEEYIPATVIVDGVAYDSVGVRFKGNSSFTHPNNKKPFRLGFDEFKSGQKIDGVKGLHLNNFWEDPSFLREKLHLDFCHAAGIHAPRANFARLFINDTAFAFYSLIEHVDKRFLGTHYGSNEGDLFKAVDGFGPTGSSVISDFRWLGADTSLYQEYYEWKTDDVPGGWRKLVGVIDSINNSAAPAAALPAVFNLPALYRAFAADIIFGNLDSYAGSGRNFYLYFNPLTAKVEWIVWDASLSMGAFPSSGVSNIENLNIAYVSSGSQRPLLGKILATPALKNEYLRTLCSVTASGFSPAAMYGHVDSIASIIRSSVYADTRKMYTNQQFETNITSDVTVGTGNRKPGIKTYIASRSTSIQTQLTALGISCSQTISPGDLILNEFMAVNDTLADPAGEADPWVEIYNATSTTLSLEGCALTNDSAQPALWKFAAGTVIAPGGFLIVWADSSTAQSGIHAGFRLAAGGGFLRLSNTDNSLLDSISFGAQTRGRSMARIPNGTGAFAQTLPTFGTVNRSSLSLKAGEIAINEFCADNDSIPDPAGETDDWIELYNTTAQAVDLSGMYLSDNFSKSSKWRFPAGSVIGAHSYLIVWADQDTTQPGIHAAFALSAGGEAIILSNKDLSVIDSVSFGQQVTNYSLARIPDGTGSFVRGRPTFNGPNVTTSVSDERSAAPARFALEQNFPNPFNPATTIVFSLPAVCRVRLTVYDLLGREVARLADGLMQAGLHSVRFDGASLPSGVYIYRLTGGTAVQSRRMLLLK